MHLLSSTQNNWVLCGSDERLREGWYKLNTYAFLNR